MELIRRDTDYAIRSLLYLAGESEQSATCAAIGKACAIPRSFAHKILKRLANAGLVTSRTGRAGGFRLAKDLAKITLGEVVAIMQGPLSVSRCVSVPESCERSSECPVSAAWGRIERQLADVLDDTTLGAIAASASGA